MTTRLGELSVPADQYSQYLARRSVREREARRSPSCAATSARSAMPRSSKPRWSPSSASRSTQRASRSASPSSTASISSRQFDLSTGARWRSRRTRGERTAQVLGPRTTCASASTCRMTSRATAATTPPRASSLRKSISLGAEWVHGSAGGRNPLFRTEFYQPIHLFATLLHRAAVPASEIRNVQLLNDQEPIAEFRYAARKRELAVGRGFGSWGELRAWRAAWFRPIARTHR